MAEIGTQLGTAGLGMLQGAVGGMIGMSLGRKNAEEQMARQKELNLQGHQLQKDMWDYTNYENQRKHMEKAGLNVGLMYGQGGGGGTTAGSQSGGSASQAPTPEVMGMALQAQNVASQTRLNEAQAKKLETETTKIGGVDTEKTSAETTNLLTTNEGIKLDNALKEGNMDNIIETSGQILENLKADNVIKVNEGKISGEQAKQEEARLTAEIANKTMQTSLMKAQESLTNQQEKESVQRILQQWKDLQLKNRGLNIQQQQANIQKFGAETQRNYPSLMNTAGSVMNNGLKAIYKLFGMDKDDTNTTSKVK